MSAKALIIDPDGNIKVTMGGDPSMFSLQLSLHNSGDALFAIDDHSGTTLNDTVFKVSESGDLVTVAGYTGPLNAPAETALFFVEVLT